MAHDSDLPCDGDGRCMICKNNPPEEEKITCKTCVTPWHLECLSARPATLADAAEWECPDCSNLITSPPPSNVTSGSEPSAALVAAIRAIESDASLSDQEKAKRRQQLLSGERSDDGDKSADDNKEVAAGAGIDVLKILSKSFNCSICKGLLERPVTTPCGHNFCLKCFEKLVSKGKPTCAMCRAPIPSNVASNPRINSSLVIAIRMAKMTKSNSNSGPPKAYFSVLNQNKPDKAYTTERAKKTGKANACSGKVFVTVPPDHFGPIPAANDPERGMGLLVGETWEDRFECRQWGAHFPHVAGIAGQSHYGAQSVALSGGYLDDEDHGEWFLYTGSGGRDLSGNKRTNKTQSFDQKFTKSNEALRVSCKMGYPVRVVRSHKEKRSSYAPEKGVRYDGIYRIEKCWRKPGIQGFKVCRYLFVRCDNDPAPWTSDENGDRPRPLPVIKELKEATDVTDRKGPPSWDFDEEKATWVWKIPPPKSKKQSETADMETGNIPRTIRHKSTNTSISENLLTGFQCLICKNVMKLPLTTPCAHNFCKSCLEGVFAGKNSVEERTCGGRRKLRSRKNVMKCPSCPNDIADFIQNPQVNRELMNVIESLQDHIKQDQENSNSNVIEQDKDINVEVEKSKEVGDVEKVESDDLSAKEEDKKEVIEKALPKRKANKKRKADDVVDDVAEVSEGKDAKVDDVEKEGKRTPKKKKVSDGKCASPASPSANTRSKKVA